MPFSFEHGPAYLVVVAITSAIYLLLVFAIRLFLRLKVNGPFGKDDWSCAISTAFGLAYSIIVVVQVGMGLGATGRKLSPEQANSLAIIGWVNGFLLTFAGFFSKISGCFLLTRITKTREHLAVAYGLMAAMVMWLLQAQISALVQCDYPRPWDSSPRNVCNDRWGHRLANAVTSWILELALLAGAIHLVHGIQMPFRTKLKVVIAFALRLLLIPPSATRLPALHASIHSPHPANHVVRLQVMSLLACQVSVISATIPCAKPFFSVFASGIMGRPRTSLLPVQRPTFSRQTSGRPAVLPSHRVDRSDSLRKLHLRPQRGVSFANAEHVPVPPEQRPQRPSLVNYQRSSTSIRYSVDFEVTFQDVGGLVDQSGQETPAPAERKARGSSAGFSWSGSWRSTRELSQKSNAGSLQLPSPSP